MNEDIVTVHDAIMGPFIATAVSKLFSSSFSGSIKEPLWCFHALPPACLNSDAAGPGRGETFPVLLILLLANCPSQDVNVDAQEPFGSPSTPPCCGSALGSQPVRLGTHRVLSSIAVLLQVSEGGEVKYSRGLSVQQGLQSLQVLLTIGATLVLLPSPCLRLLISGSDGAVCASGCLEL